MANIRHNLIIKTAPAVIYEAITTQEGLSGWWCKQATAKPEIGFVNIFVFGQFRNEMTIRSLIPLTKVEWDCTSSIDEWVGTTVSFDLEDREGRTMLRFCHGGWKEVTDTFASCNYDWARFMTSLKSFCETSTGSPA